MDMCLPKFDIYLVWNSSCLTQHHFYQTICSGLKNSIQAWICKLSSCRSFYPNVNREGFNCMWLGSEQKGIIKTANYSNFGKICWIVFWFLWLDYKMTNILVLIETNSHTFFRIPKNEKILNILFRYLNIFNCDY